MSFIICIPHQIFLSYNIKKNFIRERVALMGNRRGACRLLVERLDRKKPLGSLRRRWEGNALANVVMNLGLIWLWIGAGGGHL
jgi:hypothetical protein